MRNQSCIHVVDADFKRRAKIACKLTKKDFHVEIYDGPEEFLEFLPDHGGVLANDDGELLDAVTFCRSVREGAAHLPLAMYASSPCTYRIVDAIKAGVCSYLDWPFDEQRLLTVCKDLLDYESPERLRAQRMADARQRVATLTQREVDVLRGIVNGGKNCDIADDLGISPRTVEIHRSNMMRKLKANSAAHAVKIGFYAELDTIPAMAH